MSDMNLDAKAATILSAEELLKGNRDGTWGFVQRPIPVITKHSRRNYKYRADVYNELAPTFFGISDIILRAALSKADISHEKSSLGHQIETTVNGIGFSYLAAQNEYLGATWTDALTIKFDNKALWTLVPEIFKQGPQYNLLDLALSSKLQFSLSGARGQASPYMRTSLLGRDSIDVKTVIDGCLSSLVSSPNTFLPDAPNNTLRQLDLTQLTEYLNQ
jgi:hypothetical protein